MQWNMYFLSMVDVVILALSLSLQKTMITLDSVTAVFGSIKSASKLNSCNIAI